MVGKMCGLLLVLCAIGCANAALTTYNTLIPMRDGVKLNTLVFLNTSNPRPVVMIRTPYGATTQNSSATLYTALGYNAIIQDHRGLGLSEGKYDMWNSSATDANDTMAWIVAQPWSNKIVFAAGASAMGIAAYLQAGEQQSYLQAQCVNVATGSLYRNVYQGGELAYNLMLGYLSAVGNAPLVAMVTANEGYNSVWYPTNNYQDNKWAKIQWPAVHIAGWNDIFLGSQLDTWYAYRQLSSSPLKKYNFLVVGPKGHCNAGQVDWGTLGGYETIIGNGLLSSIMFGALQNGNITRAAEILEPVAKLATIFYFVQGPNITDNTMIGNYWSSAVDDFPTPTYTHYYLQEDGSLSTTIPTTTDASSNSSFDYNPANPVPTIGGNMLFYSQCGPYDQSSLESRDDVLIFTSAAFTQATAITGKLSAVLYVTSSTVDTDFTVKLTDVWPNGKSMSIQDGIVKLRWRNNNTTPENIVPGNIYNVTVDLWTTSYVFNVGHSLRVAISSSNFPHFNVNSNTGTPIDQQATPINATNTIMHSSQYPSSVILPIVAIPTPLNFTALLSFSAPTVELTPAPSTTASTASSSTSTATAATTTTSPGGSTSSTTVAPVGTTTSFGDGSRACISVATLLVVIFALVL